MLSDLAAFDDGIESARTGQSDEETGSAQPEGQDT
jgi:hypothetical protein